MTLYGGVAPSDLDDYWKAMRLVDEKGAAIPFWIEQYSENISRAVELVFVAQCVPSLGYKAHYLVPADRPETFTSACDLKLDTDNDVKQPRRVVGSHMLENEYYRVTVNRTTGRMVLLQQPPAGRYVYRYSITSSKGNWVAGKSWRAGMDFNTWTMTAAFCL